MGDDDGMNMTTEPGGAVTWSDQDGSTGSITSAGAETFNPDGSGTAIDSAGNEVTWDADGNFQDVPSDTGGSDAEDPYADD